MATQRKPRYYARSTVAARMVKLLGMKLHIETASGRLEATKTGVT